MGRQLTVVGFNEYAKKILAEKIKVGEVDFTRRYNDGRVESGTEDILELAYTSEVYGSINPWYDEEVELHRLTFRDGRVYETYVQESIWSSGPNIFLAIKDAATGKPIPETLWSEEDIEPI